jgi:hypothetical protein
MANLLALPNEIMDAVCHRLSCADLASFRRACTILRDAAAYSWATYDWPMMVFDSILREDGSQGGVMQRRPAHVTSDSWKRNGWFYMAHDAATNRHDIDSMTLLCNTMKLLDRHGWAECTCPWRLPHGCELFEARKANDVDLEKWLMEQMAPAP